MSTEEQSVETQEEEEQQEQINTLSQLMSVAKDVTLNGEHFESVVMLVAPYEMAEITADRSILEVKLSTELDVMLSQQGLTDFAVFSLIPGAEFPNAEELYKRCEYVPTEDTVVAARVFGMQAANAVPVCLPYYAMCKDGKIGLINRNSVKDEHLLK